MTTLSQLRFWCFGAAVPAAVPAADTELPDLPMFRAMAYRFSPKEHPEDRDEYRRAALRELPQRLALEDLDRLFEREKLRFAPFKGARLAGFYPDPALRSRCDIDLLAHPDEIGRMLEVLKADGWQTPYRYRNDHHHPGMFKRNVMLELHFRLPHFGGDAARQWELFIPEGAGFRHHLPPELELLNLFNHARGHEWENGAKMLADCGFLLKSCGEPDWKAVRELAKEFDVFSPEALFFAFPDFFPADFMPPGPPPEPELTALLRRVLLASTTLRGDRGTSVMNRRDRFGWKWWKDRFSGFRPTTLRMTYRLPGSGARGKLVAAYCRMALEKSRLAIRGLKHRDAQVTAVLRDVEALEAALERSRRN